MKAVLCLLITIGCLAACKKTNTIPPSNTQLLTQQPWKLTAFTQKLSTGELQDMYAPMSACYRDDEYVFKVNLDFEGNAGAIKCTAGDPQVFSTGTWKFTSNETQLERTITGGTGVGVVVFKIVSLTASQLMLTSEEGSSKFTLTFSH